MSKFLQTATILYVEDDKSIQEGYVRALQRYGKEVFVANDGKEGLALYQKHNPDIIVSDIKMPNMNGIEMAKRIKEINPDQPLIFTTAHSESDYTIQALELQVEGYLLKPVDKSILKSKIETISKALYLERENQKQKIVLEHLLSDSSSMIIVSDFETISFASESFLNFFHLSQIADFEKKYQSFLEIFVNDEDFLSASSKEDFLHNYEKRSEEQRVVSLITEDMNTKTFTLHLEPITIEKKKQYLFNLTDVSQLQASKKRFQQQALIDGLTGIYNRNKFEEVFSYEFELFKRYGDIFSIAILDIDHFKIFNDRFGHLIGDEMLIALAQTINSSIRSTDFFARWGGEEFVILMPKTHLEEAYTACSQLRKKVHGINHEVAGGITSSFGVTQVREGDTTDALFSRCDKALYKAKDNGRDRVEKA